MLRVAALAAFGCLSAAAQDPFRLLESVPRGGYELRTYEFYPERQLAVKALVLVPDGRTDRTTTWAKMLFDSKSGKKKGMNE